MSGRQNPTAVHNSPPRPAFTIAGNAGKFTDRSCQSTSGAAANDMAEAERTCTTHLSLDDTAMAAAWGSSYPGSRTLPGTAKPGTVWGSTCQDSN
jgi:hypothetical protein